MSSCGTCHELHESNPQLLQQALGFRSLELINDLQAVARAVPHLTASDLLTLHPGRPEPHGALAVIAPGTDLGEAFLLWEENRYRPCVSEGGHASFAGTTPFEVELSGSLQSKYGYASYELACSGIGIPNIYACLKDRGYAAEPGWLAERISAAEDSTPIIIDAALQEDPPELCRLTLQSFLSILGCEAGNLALKVVATGGVYLGGGILPRILPVLEQERDAFLRSFRCRGIMTEVMVNIPVHVITGSHVALDGAALWTLERLGK